MKFSPYRIALRMLPGQAMPLKGVAALRKGVLHKKLKNRESSMFQSQWWLKETAHYYNTNFGKLHHQDFKFRNQKCLVQIGELCHQLSSVLIKQNKQL